MTAPGYGSVVDVGDVETWHQKMTGLFKSFKDHWLQTTTPSRWAMPNAPRCRAAARQPQGFCAAPTGEPRVLCRGPALHRHRASDVAPRRSVVQWLLHIHISVAQCEFKYVIGIGVPPNHPIFIYVNGIFHDFPLWTIYFLGFNPLKGVSSHPSFLGRPSQFCLDHPNTRAGPAAAWVKALDNLLEVRTVRLELCSLDEMEIARLTLIWMIVMVLWLLVDMNHPYQFMDHWYWH